MKSEIIAERILDSSEDRTNTLTVALARPKLNEKTKAYECGYRITVADQNFTHRAAGLDAFQALQIALGMIGAEIQRIEKELKVRFIFSDLNSSGFPPVESKE